MNIRHISRKTFHAVAVFFVAGTLSLPVAAHKLNMFAYVENDKVFVEGYFSDGIKPKNSDVTVLTLTGEKLLEGKTDDDGSFTFEIPKREPLEIVLNAGMGHQTTFTLGAADLGATAAAPGDRIGTDKAMDTPEPDVSAGTSTVSSDLEKIVRGAVAEAVKPLARELDVLKNKTRLSDIIGGIGLIIGLLGGFAFYKANEMKKKEK